MANTIIAGIINRQNREKRLLKRQYVLVCLMLLLFLFSPFGGIGGFAQTYTTNPDSTPEGQKVEKREAIFWMN